MLPSGSQKGLKAKLVLHPHLLASASGLSAARENEAGKQVVNGKKM